MFFILLFGEDGQVVGVVPRIVVCRNCVVFCFFLGALRGFHGGLGLFRGEVLDDIDRIALHDHAFAVKRVGFCRGFRQCRPG